MGRQNDVYVCQKYAKMTISGVLQATPELLDYMNARTLKVVQSLMADGLASHEGNRRRYDEPKNQLR